MEKINIAAILVDLFKIIWVAILEHEYYQVSSNLRFQICPCFLKHQQNKGSYRQEAAHRWAYVHKFRMPALSLLHP